MVKVIYYFSFPRERLAKKEFLVYPTLSSFEKLPGAYHSSDGSRI